MKNRAFREITLKSTASWFARGHVNYGQLVAAYSRRQEKEWSYPTLPKYVPPLRYPTALHPRPLRPNASPAAAVLKAPGRRCPEAILAPLANSPAIHSAHLVTMNPKYVQHHERVEEATRELGEVEINEQEITGVVLSMENPEGDLDHAGTYESMHVNLQLLVNPDGDVLLSFTMQIQPPSP